MTVGAMLSCLGEFWLGGVDGGRRRSVSLLSDNGVHRTKCLGQLQGPTKSAGEPEREWSGIWKG